MFQRSTASKGSIVSKNVITKSTNGCIISEGTGNLAMEENVAFDNAGDCFVVNGAESVKMWRNLGAKTRRAALDGSSSPATFVVLSSNYTMEGNVAAGSQGQGFKISLDHGGYSFSKNAAHSNSVVSRNSETSRAIIWFVY